SRSRIRQAAAPAGRRPCSCGCAWTGSIRSSSWITRSRHRSSIRPKEWCCRDSRAQAYVLRVLPCLPRTTCSVLRVRQAPHNSGRTKIFDQHLPPHARRVELIRGDPIVTSPEASRDFVERTRARDVKASELDDPRVVDIAFAGPVHAAPATDTEPHELAL